MLVKIQSDFWYPKIHGWLQGTSGNCDDRTAQQHQRSKRRREQKDLPFSSPAKGKWNFESADFWLRKWLPGCFKPFKKHMAKHAQVIGDLLYHGSSSLGRRTIDDLAVFRLVKLTSSQTNQRVTYAHSQQITLNPRKKTENMAHTHTQRLFSFRRTAEDGPPMKPMPSSCHLAVSENGGTCYIQVMAKRGTMGIL